MMACRFQRTLRRIASMSFALCSVVNSHKACGGCSIIIHNRKHMMSDLFAKLETIYPKRKCAATNSMMLHSLCFLVTGIVILQ